MIGKNSTESKPVSMAEALDILEDRKKDGPLGYEQELAYNHNKAYTSIKANKAEKMVEELMKLGLSNEVSIKVADIMPLNELQLKHVLAMDKKPIDEEVVVKINEVVNSYRK